VNMTNNPGDGSVSIVTGYRFDARILIPKRAGQYWGPPSLVSFECRGVEQGPHLELMSGMWVITLHFPTHLVGN
jgi:hypothetical protein